MKKGQKKLETNSSSENQYDFFYRREELSPDELDSIENTDREEFENIIKEEPRWVQLGKKLMALGGARIVLCWESKIDMSRLLTRGQAFQGDVVFRRGRTSQCHSNVARQWKKLHKSGFQIVVGWALSDDGLWRQHTWGLMNDSVIETTEYREIYYGYTLNDDESEGFYNDNYY
jgi:hypothetical protein